MRDRRSEGGAEELGVGGEGGAEDWLVEDVGVEGRGCYERGRERIGGGDGRGTEEVVHVGGSPGVVPG